MTTHKLARGLMAGALILPAAARADSGDSTPQENIVVTATRSPVPLAQAPGSITVISQQDIEDSGARTLDDVLRDVPGIDILGYSSDTQNPTSNSLGMRGLGGTSGGISRGLVLVDGVPINDPFFGYVQWSRVPLDDISQVEVVRGGGSPLWGNYAEGGVINVLTAAPTGDRLTIDAGGGNFGTYGETVSGDYRINAANAVQGSLNFAGTHGYDAVPDYERAPFNRPTSSDAINLHLRDTVTPSDDITAHIGVDYHDFRQQLQTVLDSNAQQYTGTNGDIQKRFANGGALTVTAFYGHSDFRTSNSTYFPDQEDLPATTQNLNEIHQVTADSAGGSVIWSQRLGGWLHDYRIGGDVFYVDGHDNTTHFFAPDFAPDVYPTYSAERQLFSGIFGQASLTPIERLRIVVSSRVQFVNNMNGFDGTLGGAGSVPDRSYSHFDPRGDIRYQFTDALALRAAAYTAFRAPNIGDQFYSYGAGGFALLPNPRLKPETLSGGEAGVDYVAHGLSLQLTLYRTDVSDYILAEPIYNPVYSPNGWYVVQNQNIASVRAQGFEGEMAYDVGAGFGVSAGWRYADSHVLQNPADPLSVGKQIVDVPLNTLSGGVTYRAPAGWRVAANGYYVSRTAWASADHTDPGYPGRVSADPHFVLNLSGSYPVMRSVELYAQVQNLLDRRYVTTGYSAPSAQAYGTPRTVFAGVRVTFGAARP